MTDRGKVIKGFTCCDGAAVHLGHCQEDCPYFGESERADKCVEKLHSDALSLLKAQEQEISRLKHHVDCDAAEKLSSGCVGYGRGFNDDAKHAKSAKSTFRMVSSKGGEVEMNKPNWPPKDEVEHFRWTNDHTQYHSFGFGFCKAQDSCEQCDYKIRMLCKITARITEVRDKIIKKHYGVKTW